MDRYKAHQNLVAKVKLSMMKKYPKDIRIHDRHVGKFLPLVFIKKVLRREARITDWSKFVVAINKKGMADMYGYFRCHKILVHFEIEVKTGKAVQTPEQKLWQEHIENFDGCYILARSEDQAIQDLEKYLISRKLI